MEELANRLDGFKKAMENIQDFIMNYGLKLFHEEFDRLINCYVEIESNAFLSGKLMIDEYFYDEDIPLPAENSSDGVSLTFMGRILNAILNLTDSKRTIYMDSALGFFDSNDRKEIITMKTMGLLYRCIGVPGLNGLNRLLSYMICTTLT